MQSTATNPTTRDDARRLRELRALAGEGKRLAADDTAFMLAHIDKLAGALPSPVEITKRDFDEETRFGDEWNVILTLPISYAITRPVFDGIELRRAVPIAVVNAEQTALLVEHRNAMMKTEWDRRVARARNPMLGKKPAEQQADALAKMAPFQEAFFELEKPFIVLEGRDRFDPALILKLLNLIPDERAEREKERQQNQRPDAVRALGALNPYNRRQGREFFERCGTMFLFALYFREQEVAVRRREFIHGKLETRQQEWGVHASFRAEAIFDVIRVLAAQQGRSVDEEHRRFKKLDDASLGETTPAKEG